MLADQLIDPAPHPDQPGRPEATAAGGPDARAAGEAGDLPTRLLIENAFYLETVLCRFRYAVAALAVLMVTLHQPFSPVAVLAIMAVPVIVHGAARTARRRMATQGAVRLFGWRVLAADAAVAFGTYLLYLRDPTAIPAAFVPLLVFELAVRFDGRRAMIAAAAVFAAAVGVRVFFQLRVIPGGTVRWSLVLVWVLLGALILVMSRELRAQVRMRLDAQRDRARIADNFQTVVEAMLARSGVPSHAASWGDILSAVRLLCDEQPAECADLARGIADLLVPATGDFGLTKREHEIVRLLAMGYTYDRIARALVVSGSTVRNHVHNVRSKLGLSSREEVVAFARERGLVSQRRGEQHGRKPSWPAAGTGRDGALKDQPPV